MKNLTHTEARKNLLVVLLLIFLPFTLILVYDNLDITLIGISILWVFQTLISIYHLLSGSGNILIENNVSDNNKSKNSSRWSRNIYFLGSDLHVKIFTFVPTGAIRKPPTFKNSKKNVTVV